MGVVGVMEGEGRGLGVVEALRVLCLHLLSCLRLAEGITYPQAGVLGLRLE